MFPKTATVLVFVALGALSACQRREAAPAGGAPTQPVAEVPGYAVAPAVSRVQTEANGVLLTGTAPPGAPVRLGNPAGASVNVRATSAGLWSLRLPRSAEARIFGLSARVAGRVVQAQGYVLIGPDGRAAQLRAGAGAVRLDPRPAASLGALDFDRTGAAVVSGSAPASSFVSIRLDGRQVGEGRADAAGRYAIALAQPLPRGDHLLSAAGDGIDASARVAITPPQPLVGGPMHSQFTKGGLRIDWAPPGGGEQSTLLLD